MLVLVIHAIATFYMIGLIWMVQVVHYPAFRLVGADRFAEFEAAHTRRMALVLAIPAPIEIVTGALLLWERPDSVGLELVLAGGAMLAAAWIMTALVQAPLHGRLSDQHDEGLIERLITTNWWRTALWTGRGVVVAAMLAA